ncbi:MAG: hypothetical protein AB7U20_08345 [Planctomycetaceae bacterium]
MNASRLPKDDIANRVGTTPDELERFRTGESLLPPEKWNRLVTVLGLRLMQVIPGRREPVSAAKTVQ